VNHREYVREAPSSMDASSSRCAAPVMDLKLLSRSSLAEAPQNQRKQAPGEPAAGDEGLCITPRWQAAVERSAVLHKCEPLGSAASSQSSYVIRSFLGASPAPGRAECRAPQISSRAHDIPVSHPLTHCRHRCSSLIRHVRQAMVRFRWSCRCDRQSRLPTALVTDQSHPN
jgi:hypothetical protein